jgi:arginine deiminase
MPLRVDSEIGKLRAVLVHQPGAEIDRMVPSMMQNLLSEVLGEPDRLAAALVEGVERESPTITGSLDSLYLLPPIPNYFFQRDPAIVVGDRVIRSSMATPARAREPLLSGAVFEHHPRFQREGERFWFREFSAKFDPPVAWARMRPAIEGGDLLVLREDLLVIGYSERTEKTTIERLAAALKLEKSPVKRILVVAIPPQRSTMHLDTVFTQISRHECLCYPPMILSGGDEEADVYEADLTKREITWTTEDDLLSALRKRKIDLEPIPCGGTDPISPRAKVAMLLTATELSRARGGPRCMTMPLRRDPL